MMLDWRLAQEAEVFALFNKNPKETEGKTLKSSENEQIREKRDNSHTTHCYRQQPTTFLPQEVPKWH